MACYYPMMFWCLYYGIVILGLSEVVSHGSAAAAAAAQTTKSSTLSAMSLVEVLSSSSASSSLVLSSSLSPSPSLSLSSSSSVPHPQPSILSSSTSLSPSSSQSSPSSQSSQSSQSSSTSPPPSSSSSSSSPSPSSSIPISSSSSPPPPLPLQPTLRQPPPHKCKPYVTGEAGNVMIGKTLFGHEPHCLPPMKMDDNGRCFLTNDVITVKDAQRQWLTSFRDWRSHVVSFPCTNGGGPADSVNGGFSPSLDAFRHMNSAVEMLQTWFKFAVAEMASFQVFVHVGRNWNNAAISPTQTSFQNFHSGIAGNSRLAVNIFLGDGRQKPPRRRAYLFPHSGLKRTRQEKNKLIHPFTTLNVIGHEMGHALIWMMSSTEMTSSDALAIVEAFADMTGEILEYYVIGFVDWVTPSGLSGVNTKRHFRFTDSFTLSPQNNNSSSSIHGSAFVSQDVYERGNVFRHIFYRLSEGYGIVEAYRLCLDSIRFYLVRSREWSLEMAACGVLMACRDSQPGAVRGVLRAFEDFGLVVDTVLCKKYSPLKIF